MTKVIQVRGVPEAVHAELRKRAVLAGTSLSDYVLGVLERATQRPLPRRRWHGRRPGPVRVSRPRRSSTLPRRSEPADDAMIVVDASAFCERCPPGLRRRCSRGDCAEELTSASARRRALERTLAARGGGRGLGGRRIRDPSGSPTLADHPLPTCRARGVVWALRHSLTAYAATYVALAELLDLPLVTLDAGLARAPGLRTTIECLEA